MSRTYCRMVCNEIVFDVTDEHVVSPLCDFPEPVPPGEIRLIGAAEAGQPLWKAVLATLSIVGGVLFACVVLPLSHLPPRRRDLHLPLAVILIMAGVAVWWNRLFHRLRWLVISTVDGREGQLFVSDNRATFGRFYAALEAALADRAAAAKAAAETEATP